MKAVLLQADGSFCDGDRQTVSQALDAGESFWLDLEDLDESGSALLSEVLKFHPLAIEDAEHFGQRPKAEDYEGYVFLVLYGLSAAGDPVEMHCFVSDAYLVTVHRGPCEALEGVRQRAVSWRRHGPASSVMLLWRVADVLTDTFFPVMSRVDDEIDSLEDEILRRPTDEQLGRLFEMKRSLVAMRKIVTPERDMIATVVSGSVELPGMTADQERYFRDLYDHLIRVSDLVDSYRDLLSSAVDTHLSTVSNRLNAVMKQLAIIATVFLPLTFLTGFFGQNFGWLVLHITRGWTFALLGVSLPLLIVAGMLYGFRRKGWF